MPIQELTYSNLVELLRYRAENQPNQTGYIFLRDGETQEDRITYQELDQKAIAIAIQLSQITNIGSRVILVFPYNAGIDFITAFFGCLYAGVIAVPSSPPQSRSAFRFLQGRLASSEAKIIITNKQLFGKVRSQLGNTLTEAEFKELIWLTTEEISTEKAESWQKPNIEPNNLAFFQYTSGSTGMPKGVMVSHECIMSNQQMLKLGFGGTEKSVVVGWLPLFHDMGLIGNMLHPLYLGVPCILMSPLAFVQKPIRWLQAISRYQGTISGGPNFAYDLLCRQVTEKQKEELDLSSWELAFSGSEPIRLETMKKFADYFGECGFSYERFYPCYGMAEATLFITGGIKTEPPIIKYVEETALEQNRIVIADKQHKQVRPVIGCGKTWLDTKIIIVDPQTLIQCPPNQVGEIWISGSGVAKGYWQQPEETAKTFQGYLQGTTDKPYLRTGDLGFLLNDELFITGRLKEVMMFWGLSHYPQQIEQTVQKCHPALRIDSGAAFAVSVNGEEKLVIAQEVERNQRKYIAIEEVVEAIRWAVFREHLVDVHGVVLLTPGSLPKTSSGKVQRRLCRELYLKGELSIFGEWQQSKDNVTDITSTIQRYLNPMTHMKRQLHLLKRKIIRLFR
jgi:acyl-CoA synthetase (AMP-forming)/AMP-acid ligase II